MMDLEEKFMAAVGVIQGLPKDGSFQPSNEMKLQFYAFYKQATQGPCKNERPGFWEIVARAKHDAWASLGNLDRNSSMEKYIEHLKQIIETMNFSADVERFMEALGPFYEYVDEDKIIANNSVIQARAKVSQKEFRDLHKNNQNLNTLMEETESIEDMIGQYNISDSNLEDEDEDFIKEDLIRDAPIDLDCNENNDNHDKLIEEIRLTKECLEHTKTVLANARKEKEKPLNIEKVSDTFEGRPMNQQDIDKMLGNIDGFIPRNKENAPVDSVEENIEIKTEEGFHSAIASLISSPPVLSCDEDSDQEEVYEDTIESYEDDSSDCPEEITTESKTEVSSHFNVEAHILQVDTPDSVEVSPVHHNSLCIELYDSGIPGSSTESSSKHLPSLISKTNQMPPAPQHTRQLTNTALSQEAESDEILIVSSHSVPETILMSRASPSPTALSLDHLNYQLHLTVDRVQRDLEHLHSRVNSLETIVTLRDDQGKSRKSILGSWWPFADLPPKTILFMVTWPILTHGVIEIVKAAVRKSRR